jgi:hypothetical protein
MVFVLELTHNLNVLPGLLACIVTDAVTVLLLRRSILTEKVARRGHHILREYAVDPFDLLRVNEVMDKVPVTIPATLTFAELSERIARGDPQIARQQGTPIVDEQADWWDSSRAVILSPPSRRTRRESSQFSRQAAAI